MKKIEFSSKYYDSFQVLKSYFNYRNAFNLIYNEDKQTWSLPYLYDGYKNEINPIELSSKIFDSVQKFFNDNLFSVKEKKLLIENLMPLIENYGDKAIKFLETFAKGDLEYKKTTESLLKTREILKKSFVNYYSEISEPGEQNKQPTPNPPLQPLEKPYYKKHPIGMDLLRIPNEILKAYSFCEYEYKEIQGFGKIPIPEFSLLSTESHNVIVPDLCIQAYAKGFVEGYNESLVPFIDTPISRKETIIIEVVRKGFKGFTFEVRGKEFICLPENFYNSGIFEGKRYKSWNYIFETPEQFIEYFKEEQPAPTPQPQPETNPPPTDHPPPPEIKPTFTPEAIQQIFDILKDYFNPKQQSQLKKILTTGGNAKEKLLFKWYGKTLLDFFKQLLKGQFLKIPVQADLEKWISKNFMFLYRNQPKEFKLKEASKIISGNDRSAKGNRLIDVSKNNGTFEIIQLEIKNREQN